MRTLNLLAVVRFIFQNAGVKCVPTPVGPYRPVGIAISVADAMLATHDIVRADSDINRRRTFDA